ncbi:HlyD family secretion protein [Echinimonas agarilytica]|uniref:HlyD family secretion protein n=1 Tax=Echinimonas agarilytica TaxID=1215918 RepID=A0AA42B6P4_9GAMM|nr:HlyD family secretion protein [Echinimonas agarilytica]MCM2679012.1 HlyD family secretion protein [Echinimonas agarilytica]
MDLLLILTYTALCYAIFKIFDLPVNKWTVPTAVLGGIFLIGAMLLLMNYNHPFTKVAQAAYVTTPIVSQVRGPVTEVPVEGNSALNRGDILFKIDPVPFQARVDQIKAELAGAIQDVGGLNQSWEAAKAEVTQIQAERDRTKQSFDRYLEGYTKGGLNSPFSENEVENRRQMYLAKEGELQKAQAEAARAQLEFEANLEGENPIVAQLKAELVEAEYDLANTVVRAPTDGYVAQVILRPGMMAVPLPLRPVMVFVHKEKPRMLAEFQQNLAQRIEVGNEAEIIVKGAPGEIFKAQVHTIMPVISRGNWQASGQLQGIDPAASQGRILVEFKVLDDISEYHLPAGVTAEVAIYTDHFHHVSVIRKVLLRMTSWLNYVFSEGH